ncbi:MAG: alpha/beta hydrolase, partial [Myxococcota bacterium]|nr:alpha/beta hydrolase [Myxococcota bacterium]
NPITGGATPILNIAPILLIAGELNDAKKTEKTYNSVKKDPKLYTLVKGANHYGIANENNPKGANPDTTAPKVEQEEAIRAIADWSGVFLRATLHNDPDALEYITNLGYGEDDRVEVKGSF